MINLNFYYAKDYSLKKVGLLICCFLLCFSINAQQKLAALTLETFKTELNAAQEKAAFKIAGKYYAVNKSFTEGKVETYASKTLYHLSFQKQQLAMQAMVKNLRLTFKDTLLVKQNEQVIQIITADKLFQESTLTESTLEHLELILIWRSNLTPTAQVSELLLLPAYQNAYKTEDFGDADVCQVNTACSEGNNYAKQIQSTVRILLRVGSIAGWCTGTLINKVTYDYEPLLLSAEHCGIFNTQFASTNDLQQWVFYFNYQSATCTNPASEGALAAQAILGASLLARSDDEGGEKGSDLLLLKLATDIPPAYNAYFSGWSRNELIKPVNAITIHHPEGDIKKISTNRTTISSGAFGPISEETHWLLRWSATQNGFGTTEGGSSGSGLFSENGLLRGVLTGGSSSCSNNNGLDFYGKFSYSWNQNSSAPNRQLQPWLDPNNSGAIALGGAFLGDEKPADSTVFEYAPNPTKNVVVFKGLGSFTETCKVAIFSMEGKIMDVFDKIVLPNESLDIALGSYRQGLYIIRIVQGEQIYTEKVIKLN